MTETNGWCPRIGERVAYFGHSKQRIKNPGVVAGFVVDSCNSEDEFVVAFDDVRLAVRLSELWPVSEFKDPDLDNRNWQQLLDEIMVLRAALKYVLSQRGDDVCWRDFYVAAARVLPAPWNEEALLKSVLPKADMLDNCHTFVGQLCAHEKAVSQE